MIIKFLCSLGIHYYKIVSINFTFSYIEQVETLECLHCKSRKIIRKKKTLN